MQNIELNIEKQIEVLSDFYEINYVDKIVTVLNNKLENVYSSDKYVEMLGLQKKDIYMKRLSDIPESLKNRYVKSTIAGTTNFLKYFFKHRPFSIEGIVKLDTFFGWKLFLVKCSLIRNELYIFEFDELQIKLMNDILYIVNFIGRLKQKPLIKATMQRNKFDIILKEEEKVVLFLLSIGKSYKIMSNILSKLYGLEYKESKIKSIIINSLLPKFNAITTEELVMKYLESGLCYNIPSILVSQIDTLGVISLNF